MRLQSRSQGAIIDGGFIDKLPARSAWLCRSWVARYQSLIGQSGDHIEHVSARMDGKREEAQSVEDPPPVGAEMTTSASATVLSSLPLRSTWGMPVLY